MKIQLQYTTFYPVTGGVENYLYYASKALMKLGHKSEVLCSKYPGELNSKDIHEGIEIIRHPSFYTACSTPVEMHQYLRKLETSLVENSEEVDIVLSRHPHYGYASLKALPHIPCIYIQATAYPRYLALASKARDLSEWNRIIRDVKNVTEDFWVEKETMALCHQLVVLSEMRKKEISDFYGFSPERFKVVPPGVDLVRFRPRQRDHALAREFELPTDAKIILSVARLSPEKNFPLLLKAFARLRIPQTYLVIVGDGPQRSYLEQLSRELDIAHTTRFTGFRDDAEKFYCLADIFVLPSLYEGLGQVFLEAMSSGVPCIGLKQNYPEIIVASEEIIIDGKTGFCINHSLEHLAEKIELILKDDNLKWQMGAKGRKVCEQRYVWEEHVKKLLFLQESKDNCKIVEKIPSFYLEGGKNEEVAKLAEAAEIYDKILDIEKGREVCLVRYRLMNIFMTLKNRKQVVKRMREIIGLNPFLPLAEQVDEMDLRRLARFYLSFLEQELDNAAVLYALGHIMSLLKQDEEAIKYFRKAIDRDSKYPWACYELSGMLIKKNRWLEAKSFSENCVELAPENPRFRYQLSVIYEKISQADKGIRELRQVLESNGVDWVYRQALEYSNYGKPDEAIKEYKRLLSIDSKNPDAHFLLANAYFQLGQREDAYLEYQKTIEINALHLNSHYMLALEYEWIGEVDRAAEEYKKVLESTVTNEYDHFLLGIAFSKLGQSRQAVQEYRRFVESDPSNHEAHRKLAEEYDKLGDKRLAEQEFKKAEELAVDKLPRSNWQNMFGFLRRSK